MPVSLQFRWNIDVIRRLYERLILNCFCKSCLLYRRVNRVRSSFIYITECTMYMVHQRLIFTRLSIWNSHCLVYLLICMSSNKQWLKKITLGISYSRYTLYGGCMIIFFDGDSVRKSFLSCFFSFQYVIEDAARNWMIFNENYGMDQISNYWQEPWKLTISMLLFFLFV